MELLFIAMYTPNMITQLLAPCAFGSNVAKRGENLLFNITASNWISATLHYKRLYMITLGKLQTTFATKVGYVIPLSLNTFISVSIQGVCVRMCDFLFFMQLIWFGLVRSGPVQPSSTQLSSRSALINSNPLSGHESCLQLVYNAFKGKCRQIKWTRVA